jgi:hypothetical protein
MTDFKAIGIDLNGLYDTAAFDNVDAHLTGGAIPSVVIANRDHHDRVEVICGEEATLSPVGRNIAASPSSDDVARILSAWAIDSLREEHQDESLFNGIAPARIMAAAVSGLAEARGPVDSQPVVVAIPDDGKFNDDAQQQLLNSLSGTGLKIHLLWRSVAALLAMNQDIRSHSKELKDKKVGIISLLDEGVNVCRLIMKFDQDCEGNTYLIPKRTGPGRVFPYPRRIQDIARDNATDLSDLTGTDTKELLLGTPIPVSAAIGMRPETTVVRTPNGWKRIDHDLLHKPTPLILDDAFTDQIDRFLSDVGYLVYEGPALLAPVSGNDKNLMNMVSAKLRTGIFKTRTGQNRKALSFNKSESQLVSRGCHEYGIRLQDGRKTYFDQLPQLRLAVSRNREPVFSELIPSGMECEGGKNFSRDADLNLSIPARSKELQFYLFKEGETDPRRATERLRRPPKEDIPIRMKIEQSPAQGRARLTIIGDMPQVSVNWDNMEVLAGETEETISEKIQHPEIAVPPVTYHPCHPYLWSVKRGKNLLNHFSLSELIDDLTRDLPFSGSDTEARKIGALRAVFCRLSSPYTLSFRAPGPRHNIKELHRPVSSAGEFPAPGEGLEQHSIDNLKAILRDGADSFLSPNATLNFKRQISNLGGWAFLACPEILHEDLMTNPDWGKLYGASHYFRCAAKIITSIGEFETYFSRMEESIITNQEVAKIYHADGLFYLLSLRENAAKAITAHQSELFSKALTNQINDKIKGRRPKTSTLVRACLRALSALLRYRLADPGFMRQGEYFGDTVVSQCERIVKIVAGDPAKRAVMKSAMDLASAITAEEAIPVNLLIWDSDDQNSDESDDED